MQERELLELIKKGEGPKLEFKRDGVRPEQLAKEIVAFANMNGGHILLGVEDDGQISGMALDRKTHEWIMDTIIGRYVTPHLVPDYEEITLPEGTVGVITIPQGNAKPYMCVHNSTAYMRYGTTCKVADRNQMLRLGESGGMLKVEQLPVHGSSVADLDERRYKEYFLRILGKDETDTPGWIKRLKNRNFLVGNGTPRCSQLAYVLFAKDPVHKLPQAEVRLTGFRTTDKGTDYDTTFDHMLHMPAVELRGNNNTAKNCIEPALHDMAIAYLQPHISREALQGTIRQRLWDYPPKVLRELLVNALMHRDWTKQNYIRVELYVDRLTIFSPGALPNSITVEKIKDGVRHYRNQGCAFVFRDYGYLEQHGMGISDIVIPTMKQENGREPDFDATEDSFTVTLWKKDSATPQT